MAAARNSWKAARVPYMQTEAYRFGNAIVDEWEGEVNSWPLDEGLIDYVAESYGASSDDNPLYTLDVIAKLNRDYLRARVKEFFSSTGKPSKGGD